MAQDRAYLGRIGDDRDELHLGSTTNVYDHLVRLYDIVEGLRDLAAGALEAYLSVINNKMNEVMKTFTLITTLSMPISTASAPPPAWTGRIAFGAMCAAMVLVPALMYLWLKRRKWV